MNDSLNNSLDGQRQIRTRYILRCGSVTLHLMFAIFLIISLKSEVSADMILSLCFERKSPEILKVVAMRKGERFQVIPTGGLDSQIDWFTESNVGQGATILSRGGQYQEYLQLLEIKSNTVVLKRYGFAKRLGEFDEIVKVAISTECVTDSSS